MKTKTAAIVMILIGIAGYNGSNSSSASDTGDGIGDDNASVQVAGYPAVDTGQTARY